MTRKCITPILFLGTALLIALVPVSAAKADSRANSALFEVAVGKSRFTIKLQGRRALQEARRIIRTKKPVFMMGQVIPASAAYNRKWNFHVAPKSIQFIELSMDLCDAAPEYVQRHLPDLGKDLLPGNIWCPWHSVLVKELKR